MKIKVGDLKKLIAESVKQGIEETYKTMEEATPPPVPAQAKKGDMLSGSAFARAQKEVEMAKKAFDAKPSDQTVKQTYGKALEKLANLALLEEKTKEKEELQEAKKDNKKDEKKCEKCGKVHKSKKHHAEDKK